MAGIYIHIPFCKQACHYCDFHFVTSLKNKDKLIDAILLEIEQRFELWQDEKFDTIYFGGGTPSYVDTTDIDRIIRMLNDKFDIAQTSEITLEANPDDLTNNKIKHWKKAGINRLSIGIQSFHQDDLIQLHRSHTATQAYRGIKNLQDAGIDNISIDLIYGIPGLSDQKWLYNLQQVADLHIPHLSAYALTVEAKTALAHQIKKDKLPAVSEQQSAEQFEILRKEIHKQGFLHYEISNFAKPGYISKHNSNYWKNKAYLGLGPAAHSYINKTRRWNIHNNIRYIKNMENQTYYEIEQLSKKDRYNEIIMTGLRTIWGVDLKQIEKLGVAFIDKLLQDSQIYIGNQLFIENNHLKTAPDTLFVIEGIISDLFLLDDL